MPRGEIRHTILSVYDGSMYPYEAIRMLEGRERACRALIEATVTMTAAWLAGEPDIKPYMIPVLEALDKAQDAMALRPPLPAPAEAGAEGEEHDELE